MSKIGRNKDSELMPKQRQLAPREQRFLEEYLVDLDPKRAAIAAGYAATTANIKAFGWVSESKSTKPHLFWAIQKAKKERAERTQLDADRVLQRLAAIDAMDIADILNNDFTVKPLYEWPTTWRRTLSGLDVKEIIELDGDGTPKPAILKKIKWPDKLRTLEILGKHVNVKAFAEQHRHKHGLEEETATTLKDIYRSIAGKRDGLPVSKS